MTEQIQLDNEINTLARETTVDGNLKRLREQRALSLSDLARMAKLSRVTINRIENSKQKPMPKTIRKLAQALRVRVEDLTSEQARFI